MNWLKNLSLKMKLVMLLMTLTGTMLSTFGWIAIRDFENDKIAYVLDSGLAHSQNSAWQIRSEVELVVERVKFLMRGFNAIDRDFHPYTTKVFPGETRFDALLTFRLKNGILERDRILRKPNFSDANLEIVSSYMEKRKSATVDSLKELNIAKPFDTSKWLLTLRFELEGSSEPIIVGALLNTGNFLKTFESGQIQDTFLVNSNNEIVIAPKNPSYSIDSALVTKALNEGKMKLKSEEGIFQFQAVGGEILLVAVADIGLSDFKVVSMVPKSAALEAVRLIIIKSTLFLAFLFCVTLFLSVLSSATLTASLKKLLEATREIAKGNFGVTVDIQSGDEIGSLSDGFNKMTGEIQRLMRETAEKTRMEGELQTAKLVQSTLFPEPYLRETDLEIKGVYQPASECSGDWWYHKRIGQKTLFCIGDATGHGVSAALLTASARSAASAIETFPHLSLHDMISVFNSAIYNTAKGQVMMTFFLGLYDHNSGIISYCNASHEPPLLVPHKENVAKGDLMILQEGCSSRLGQDPNSQFKSAEIKLNPGDKVFLYTDGVTELKNKDGGEWGERALIRCLIKCHNEGKNIVATVDEIAKKLHEFRDNQPLNDDVTYFIMKRTA